MKWKRTVYNTLFVIIAVFFVYLAWKTIKELFVTPKPEIVLTAYVEPTVSRWDIMYEAIKICESGNNPQARNSQSTATGDIQALEVYVRDANRILGEEYFTLDRRTDPVKTRYMFDIIQGFYNPGQNIHKAIISHYLGPGNFSRKSIIGDWYYRKVIRTMAQIENEYKKHNYKIIP